MADILTDEQVAEMSKKVQVWLDVETDHWTDDTRARWLINRVPKLIATLRHVQAKLEFHTQMHEDAVKNMVELKEENARLQAENERLCEKEIGKLAKYILDNNLMPRGFEGSACECAISLIAENIHSQEKFENVLSANDWQANQLLKYREENARLLSAVQEFKNAIVIHTQDSEGWMELTIRTSGFQKLRQALATEGESKE